MFCLGFVGLPEELSAPPLFFGQRDWSRKEVVRTRFDCFGLAFSESLAGVLGFAPGFMFGLVC